MATTITDAGASILITEGSQAPRNILKSQIIELTIFKNNVIKIDIGKGALENIFIPYGEVTQPITAGPAALREAINNMLSSGVIGEGYATALKQDEQKWIMSQIYAMTDLIKKAAVSIDEKVFYLPSLVDDSGMGTIYKGYAAPGTSQELSLWAIERVQRISGIDVHTWADGARLLNKKWVDRETLSYF